MLTENECWAEVEGAKTKAALRVVMSVVWGAGGNTEVFSKKIHPELQGKIKRHLKKVYPIALEQELAKLKSTSL